MTLLTLGQRLRAARTAQKLTQQDVADRTGFHHTAIAHFEHDRRSPCTDNLVLLCKALGCSADYLLGLSNQKLEEL